MNISKQRGVTLAEVLIAVAVIGIIAAIAVPSYQETIERNRLKQASESLLADVLYARTEAIKKSVDLTMTIDAGTPWCYGINDDNTACDCATAGSCALKAVAGSEFQGISLDADDSVTFSFRRGTANAMGTTLSSTNFSTRVVVSTAGRARICNPGDNGLLGYPDC